jgi:hypothetical protein
MLVAFLSTSDRRRAGSRRLRREALAVVGEGRVTMPPLIGHATGEHITDPDEDVIEALAAMWPMLMAA